MPPSRRNPRGKLSYVGNLNWLGELEAPTFKANKDGWVWLIADFCESDKVCQGGGKKATCYN